MLRLRTFVEMTLCASLIGVGAGHMVTGVTPMWAAVMLGLPVTLYLSWMVAKWSGYYAAREGKQ